MTDNYSDVTYRCVHCDGEFRARSDAEFCPYCAEFGPVDVQQLHPDSERSDSGDDPDT